MPTIVSNIVSHSPLSAGMITMNSAVARLEVMFIIFFASLFAASFPTLSKQIPILRIPPLVFFIGKHFGTGVILATAFTHLLDDAFRSLRNPLVKIRYGNVGKWTGLIILGSLLLIFLVEYISTSYVEYLQSKPSAPPSLIASVQPSRPASLKRLSRSISYENALRSTISGQPQETISTNQPIVTKLNTGLALPTETTPLLPPNQPITDASFRPQLRREVSASNLYPTAKSLHSRDHSPHRCHHLHPIIPPDTVTGVPIDVLTNSPRVFRQLGMSHSHLHELVGHEQTNEGEDSDHHHHDEHDHPRVGRRRQVVGLLVLQLGIMIHSLVIGLTLAVTEGSDFTSLTTAILFHQLFEGLSLGIRIASLPPKDVEYHHIAVEDEENLRQLASSLRYVPPPIIPNLDSDPGAAPSNSTLPSQRGHTAASTDSQTIGRGIEVQSLPSREREVHWLQPTLSILFAVTTPFGMCAGMTLWKEGSDTTQMLLIKGTMSAISAGMLIYAATVEMIAGDFVFGDVDGGHGHGHGHGHLDPHQLSSDSRLDNDNDDDDNEPHTPDGKHLQEQLKMGETTTTKKALAVLSLFAGVAGMVIIG